MKFGSVCSGIEVKAKKKVGRPVSDVIGKRFGRLLVVCRIETKKLNPPNWECLCDCGNTVVLLSSYLNSGRNKSCGCYRRDRTGQLYRKHGLSKTTRYTMFYDARKRAVAAGIPFSIEPEDIIIPTHCPILGVPLGEQGCPRNLRASLDRIIPSKGYVIGNICVISFRANRLNGDATTDELRRVISYIEGTL